LTGPDRQLVERAVGGDRAAFGRLAERYRGRVHAFSLAVCVDAGEAAELTQETFVRALANLPRLEDPDRFGSWLRGIQYTVSQDQRRRAARERQHRERVGRAAAGRAASSQPDVAVADDEVGQRALVRLGEELALLSEPCRIALDLRFREGLAYAQIAEVMGVPTSTVRGLLYRGTRTLRDRLRPALARDRGEETRP